MSRTAGRDRDVTTTDHDQNRDDDPDGIPLGAYRDGGITISGTYHPERDTVEIDGNESIDSSTITRATWLKRSRDKTIDRVAQQRRDFLQDGTLLDQPECDGDECVCRLTPIEIAHSEQVTTPDGVYCRSCLQAHVERADPLPWVVPEDRTIDRSVVETVQ